MLHSASMTARLAALLGALLTAPVAAQAAAVAPGANATPAPESRPDPADAAVPVPATSYLSPFARYRRGGDDPPLGWRQANDSVTRIGGWRTYLRQSQQPDPAPSAPAPR